MISTVTIVFLSHHSILVSLGYKTVRLVIKYKLRNEGDQYNSTSTGSIGDDKRQIVESQRNGQDPSIHQKRANIITYYNIYTYYIYTNCHLSKASNQVQRAWQLVNEL